MTLFFLLIMFIYASHSFLYNPNAYPPAKSWVEILHVIGYKRV